MRKVKIEATKFTIVGGINFVFTFLMFFTLVRILNVNYSVSLVIASVIGVVFTYVLNHKWVFKPEHRLLFNGRFAKYFAASLFSIVLNLVVLRLVVERTGYDPFYVQTMLIPFVVVFNFTTSKLWSLRPIKLN